MQTNLLIMDNQNTISSKRSGHGMGLIGEGGKQGGEETNFSSSLAEATTEQRSHQGPAGKSKMVRKEIGNGESESEELKREANGGFDKAATNFSPFLALERKKGAKSSNERAVRGEEFLGFGLKGSPAKLKVIDKGTQSHNDADHKTSMDLNKNNVFKVDPAGFGLERQHGESEGRKVAVPLEGVEKAEGPLKELGEESGRIDRGVQGQEQAAQKSGVGQMKNSPEKFARKELRIEGSNPTLGTEPKDARPETTKAKVLEEGLAHKKIEKTELNSGENSNLSSKNHSTPDKGAGAVSHSKEPHASTKSSQADILKQIVTKAAFSQETQKESARPQGLDRAETLLHEMRSKSATKNQLDLKVEARPQGFEKAEGLLKELGEESGRINRGVQGQEQAAQKSGVGQMKGSPEEFGQKGFRTEGATQRMVAGAISHSKEPHASTKSSQADTLKQIVTKAAFSQETQKESARPQGLDRVETLLHETRSKSATKNQLDLKVEARPQGFEKAEGLLKEIGEESGRINRGIQGQEQAAQKSGVGQMKGSPEEFGQKGFRTEGATQRMVAGAISHSKEPHASTKSSQADTLKQIVTKAASGQETQKESARPQDLDRVETLLHETRSKSATKNQLDLKIATGPQGFEKAEDPIKNLEEESGRINRGVQGQEQAAQKSGVGQMKGSPEEFGQKEARIDGSTPTWGSEPKEVRSETTKAKVLGEGLAHKKIEKTELNSGENSNLSSRNYSTPDKGTGAISHSKEPHHSTKSSQTDTLKQIVTKAAFNLENGRSEFKIDLKPETLGHLKMQILTENHHVTVRILTESPLVKEMIESNLVQLKVNFQNQGLEIEKFDVSVALGSDKNGAGGGRYESKKMREKFADTDNGYGEKAEDAGEADNSIKRDQQESAVNLFV